MHNPQSQVNNQYFHDLAWGPKRKVLTWQTYFVNRYKFHTDEWSCYKKTINSGVCVKGSQQATDQLYYYGIIKEIIQLEYTGHPMKQVVLFNCEWFDTVLNRGMKVHKDYGIVEIRHNRRYPRYDPFIVAQKVIQVYYLPYPTNIRDKQHWWVVIMTRPRRTVDDRYKIEVAYQEDTISHVNSVPNDNTNENLVDDDCTFEEVDGIVDINVNMNDEDEEEFDEFDSSQEDDTEHDQYGGSSDNEW